MKHESEILTAHQAAELLRVSRSTFQRLVTSGRVKSVEPANPLLKRQVLRFKREDIERLLKL
jgi:excisionase family DNA binding protein